MRLLSANARRLPRVLSNPPVKPFSSYAAASHTRNLITPRLLHSSNHQRQNNHLLRFAGIPAAAQCLSLPLPAPSAAASYSTEAAAAPTEALKELYDKIMESVNVKRTMAPNAWMWSLIDKCKNGEDIKLLFDALQNLRRFRLSNLRIHANFNDHLCREVAKACARAGAIDFGMKTLWKHNVYGLTPTVGSANHLLSYADDQNDIKLMTEVIGQLKRNDLPLQPGTADIIFRIRDVVNLFEWSVGGVRTRNLDHLQKNLCHKLDNWELMSKYSKKFLKAGVKLRKSSFDLWMDLAAKRGDSNSIWKIEKLRSELMTQHTLVSGFSCAKGLLLEHKPQEAAAVIEILNQTLPETKKSGIMIELQKLVTEWPLDVVKHQEEENKKELAAALKRDIPAMVTGLLNMGLQVGANLEDLTSEEKIPC